MVTVTFVGGVPPTELVTAIWITSLALPVRPRPVKDWTRAPALRAIALPMLAADPPEGVLMIWKLIGEADAFVAQATEMLLIVYAWSIGSLAAYVFCASVAIPPRVTTLFALRASVRRESLPFTT